MPGGSGSVQTTQHTTGPLGDGREGEEKVRDGWVTKEHHRYKSVDSLPLSFLPH